MVSPRILVAGFGNPLIEEDRCGLDVATRLAALGIRGVEVLILGRGVQSLLHLSRHYDYVVAVDSGPADAVVEVSGAEEVCPSTHDTGVLEMLALISQLGEIGGKPLKVYLATCRSGAGKTVELILDLLKKILV